MEISEIIMETFTLGTAIGLNMTHNAAAWNRARLVEAKFSCFSWCINGPHEINPTGKFPKRPWEESTVH